MFTRLTDNTFKLDSKTTIGVDFKIKTISYDDNIYKIQLWDTAGQERYKNFHKSYFSQSKGILLVYDVTQKKSFLNVIKWLHDI